MNTNSTLSHGFLTLWLGIKEIAIAIACIIDNIVKRFPWTVVITTMAIAIIMTLFTFVHYRYREESAIHQRDSLALVVSNMEEAQQ